MQMGSYCGKILQVDLTTGKIETKMLDPEIARDFIGDFGINLRLAYDLIKPGIDPLSPLNVIILGVGTLVGTQLPSSVRCSVTTKYPLTGIIASGNSGMGLGKRLKAAGYDHVIITGKADRHVYLKIWNDDVQICDAGDLWGKDIYQTTDELWQELGKKHSVIAIGQAGENLVNISVALVDNMSAFGTGGLPAVMGSKNIKAIAIGGTSIAKPYDPERYKAAMAPLLKAYRDDPERQSCLKYGKMRPERNAYYSYTPYKNWTELYPGEDYEERYGIQQYLNVIQGKVVGCPGCPYPCKDHLEVKEGEFKGLTTNVSSLGGTMRMLGMRTGAGSIQRLTKLIDISNRYGISRHGFPPAMDFAVELYERGIITKEDTGGLVLKRDFETAVKLLEMITFRQGIGDVLADGDPGIIKRFGKECEKFSCHIKGVAPVFDARAAYPTQTFCQVTNIEGGHSQMTLAYAGIGTKNTPEALQACADRLGMPQDAIARTIHDSAYNIARFERWCEDFLSILTGLGVCKYRIPFLNVKILAELYSAATGIETSAGELQKAGERISNLYKAINVREGQGRKDDRIPPRWSEPLKTPGGEDLIMRDCTDKPLSADDMEKLLDDYYEERGWDVARGIPSREKLIELGLDDVAEDFQKQGIFK